MQTALPYRQWLGRCAAVAALLLAALLLAAHAAAADDGHLSAEERHHLSVFLGGTTIAEGGETGFTYGLDYEYGLTPNVGIGVVLERAEGNVDATTILAVADVHLIDKLVLQVGPGIEFLEDSNPFVVRAGLYYELEIGDFSFAPSLHFDFAEETSIVYGVIIGRKF